MSTRLHPVGPSQHAAGIFADMTVDGPEIGTLVLIVDRAKNLPNRKTMGKQNPYCAARLGKEAKKTETDRRGGQTPRWDQELRFIVHDSPDYNNLKISLFSEDKRTDLIGEAWVDLTDIIKAGGGKSDLWQGLHCKGKYAGELRIELTYYDIRPKPEKPDVAAAVADEMAQASAARVKRRPLPPNLNTGHTTPNTIPGPAVPVRARHGPRDLRTPLRANSMPPETTPWSQPHPQPLLPGNGASYGPEHGHGSSPIPSMHQTPQTQYYDQFTPYQEPAGYQDAAYGAPQPSDFLPELPPSNRQRARQTQPVPQQPRPHHDVVPLPHSYSSPSLPMHLEPRHHDEDYQLRTDYPDPIPDLEFQHQQLSYQDRRRSGPPSWQSEYGDAAHDLSYAQHEESDLAPPPPPPVHSNSAPVVTQYHAPAAYSRSSPTSTYADSPSHVRHNSAPGLSPLQQSSARTYGQPRRTPPHDYHHRGPPADEFSTPSPDQRLYASTPPSHGSGQSPSSYSRQQPVSRSLPNRHNVADPYGTTTPTRPHPLSQEVPRPHSPDPQYRYELPDPSSRPFEQPQYEPEYRSRDAVPLLKPRALSPRPAQQPPPPQQSQSAPSSSTKPRSTYSIQNPVRAFESSDASPLSTSHPNPTSKRTTPIRKSISPQPPAPNSTSIPISHDSFDVHNPHTVSARAALESTSVSPYSPYQIRSGPDAHPRPSAGVGPIVDWHGQEIDPSDHLPVDSWAPEPEKKAATANTPLSTATKTYGLGRDRDFGPRSSPGEGRQHHLSKDTVVSFRSSAAHADRDSSSETTRNRLQKKDFGAGGGAPRRRAESAAVVSSAGFVQPLRERRNYNDGPPAPDHPSAGLYEHHYPHQQQQLDPWASGQHRDSDALAREIESIDLGPGGGGRRAAGPASVAFVPVRSHKDRRTFY